MRETGSRARAAPVFRQKCSPRNQAAERRVDRVQRRGASSRRCARMRTTGTACSWQKETVPRPRAAPLFRQTCSLNFAPATRASIECNGGPRACAALHQAARQVRFAGGICLQLARPHAESLQSRSISLNIWRASRASSGCRGASPARVAVHSSAPMVRSGDGVGPAGSRASVGAQVALDGSAARARPLAEGHTRHQTRSRHRG